MTLNPEVSPHEVFVQRTGHLNNLVYIYTLFCKLDHFSALVEIVYKIETA
jgi:hypothetical protein